MATTMTDEQQILSKIYYYFMLIDGQLSPKEADRLSLICKEIGVSQADKDKLIVSIENRLHFVKTDGSVDTEKVFIELKSLLYTVAACNISNNKRLCLSTIWNLILLANVDGVVSEPEVRYISFLGKKWNIEQSVIDEFIDTARTIEMLSKKREWISSTQLPQQQIQKQQNVIDADIERLVGYIQRTI